jgi:hypothetical protein
MRREVQGEALTGEGAGWAIEPRKSINQGADAVASVEGNTGRHAKRVPSRPCVVEDPQHVQELRVREPGDLAADRRACCTPVRIGKAGGLTPMMPGGEKSDLAVVAGKSANADGQPPAEPMEPRAGAEGNAVEHGTRRTLGRESVSSGLDRVRQRAREKKEEKFTALLQHVDVDLLRSAYGWLAKEAAAGVDGVTWRDYGQDLEPRLADLKDRIHRGAYRALPSRRGYIPKPDGRQRPLGIPTRTSNCTSLPSAFGFR